MILIDYATILLKQKFVKSIYCIVYVAYFLYLFFEFIYLASFCDLFAILFFFHTSILHKESENRRESSMGFPWLAL